MEAITRLLDALEADEYVRFKHGRALKAARAALGDRPPEPDWQALSSQIEALGTWARRYGRVGSEAGKPAGASARRRSKSPAAPDAES